ncbi:hypothetical protein SESBI_13188 [Sesbania bispinosa]|nr:hypothetical protein SESBI_13188 [Sesbania bispinosa]
MEKSLYQPEKGLGCNFQGERLPISLPRKHDKFGLGYESLLEKKVKKWNIKEVQTFPHLRDTFPAQLEV